jgi:K+-transporting ATPase A subunit
MRLPKLTRIVRFTVIGLSPRSRSLFFRSCPATTETVVADFFDHARRPSSSRSALPRPKLRHMTLHGWLLIAVFVLLVAVTVRPLVGYMAWVFSGQCASNRFLGLFERAFFRMAFIDPSNEHNWVGYTQAILVFNLAGLILLFCVLLLQGSLPLNPQGFGAVAPDLAFNTAVSFVTNTSWQSYAGETTLSYFGQMAGITVQSFLSAATGMAAAIALVRGFARRSSETIGNAWVDLTRATLHFAAHLYRRGFVSCVPRSAANP